VQKNKDVKTIGIRYNTSKKIAEGLYRMKPNLLKEQFSGCSTKPV